ncbi:hypothetical protein PSTG_04302 [Puccinia striiformis f. sp. tritici PST-78]|uniref:VTT domain-containing protein n=1 Tax=Puccinia striiformis f. sp. tritici PST-78 TaxID=1165861 RepID=A0A0L0VTS1_9BASI|nr:hypothetical protein PSTG_04302 [Puccinia striiformis f. sp. tritici PST-78]
MQTHLIKPISVLLLTTATSLLIITTAIHSIPFLRLPTSLELIKNQINHLRLYSSSSPSNSVHLTIVLSIIFISKQAFSIPGTALLNILIGAIYPTWFSTPLTCLLTAIGSTGAYLIAKTARPIIIILIPRPLQLIQRAIDPFRIKGTTNQFKTAELSSYLLIARFLPIVPYAALNLTCGVLELPLLPFFWTLSVGSLPYNLLTTQLGDILRTASESSDHNVGLNEIWSTTLILKLISLSLLAILPILFKEPLRNLIQHLTTSTTTTSSSKEWISDQGGRRNTIDSVSESEDLENRLLILDHPSSYHHLHQQPHLIESSASSTDYEEYDLSSNTSDSSSTDELVIQFNPTPRSSSSSSIISKSTSPTLLSSTKLNGLKIIDHHHHLSIVQAPPPSRKLATLNPSPSLNNNNNINCSTFV